MKVGILALQGDFAAHAAVLTRLNVAWQYVRSPEDLLQVQALILPGGESTSALHLLDEADLFNPIQIAGQNSMPMFGTCAGAILLAKKVTSPVQRSLDLVDITVQRNAYGRQADSRIVNGTYHPDSSPIRMAFIRAPRFVDLAPDVQVIVDFEGEPVCVQQKHFLVAAFHPELTGDDRLHQHFLQMI